VSLFGVFFGLFFPQTYFFLNENPFVWLFNYILKKSHRVSEYPLLVDLHDRHIFLFVLLLVVSSSQLVDDFVVLDLRYSSTSEIF
jgi:hypothetical protein